MLLNQFQSKQRLITLPVWVSSLRFFIFSGIMVYVLLFHHHFLLLFPMEDFFSFQGSPFQLLSLLFLVLPKWWEDFRRISLSLSAKRATKSQWTCHRTLIWPGHAQSEHNDEKSLYCRLKEKGRSSGRVQFGSIKIHFLERDAIFTIP